MRGNPPPGPPSPPIIAGGKVIGGKSGFAASRRDGMQSRGQHTAKGDPTPIPPKLLVRLRRRKGFGRQPSASFPPGGCRVCRRALGTAGTAVARSQKPWLRFYTALPTRRPVLSGQPKGPSELNKTHAQATTAPAGMPAATNRVCPPPTHTHTHSRCQDQTSGEM